MIARTNPWGGLSSPLALALLLTQVYACRTPDPAPNARSATPAAPPPSARRVSTSPEALPAPPLVTTSKKPALKPRLPVPRREPLPSTAHAPLPATRQAPLVPQAPIAEAPTTSQDLPVPPLPTLPEDPPKKLRPLVAKSLSSARTGAMDLCAVLADGRVACGGAERGDAPSLKVVKGLKNAESVEVGGSLTCAVLRGGGTRCWSGEEGEMEAGSATDGPPKAGVKKLSFDGASACALMLDGRVLCWGTKLAPDDSDFDDPDKPDQPDQPERPEQPEEDTSRPRAVRGLGHVVDLHVRYPYACALRDTGDVYCWGKNPLGELGAGTNQPHRGLVRVVGIQSAVSLSGADGFTCVTLRDGTARCWGCLSFWTATTKAEPVPHSAKPASPIDDIRDLRLFGDLDRYLTRDDVATTKGFVIRNTKWMAANGTWGLLNDGKVWRLANAGPPLPEYADEVTGANAGRDVTIPRFVQLEE